LYLAATLNAERRFAPFKGGMGRTLPPALAELFTKAHFVADASVSWAGPSATHVFRIVRGESGVATLESTSGAMQARVDDFSRPIATGPQRLAVTQFDDTSAAIAGHAFAAPEARQAPDAPEAPEVPAVGFLVHRALAAGWTRLMSDDDVAVMLERLSLADERAAIDNLPTAIRCAAAALVRLRSHPDVKDLFDAEGTRVHWRRHEVPFSLRATDGTIRRGVIDCLVKHDGGIEVVEFKTGRPHSDHRRQLDIYLEAARALFPDLPVRGRLIYAG
jgi:PD-(D/E)XK nuclease superfamily